MAIQVYRKFDPDALAADHYQPREPMCQRCGIEASWNNPIGVTFRPSWNPMKGNKNPRGHMDALCARCREWLANR